MCVSIYWNSGLERCKQLWLVPKKSAAGRDGKGCAPAFLLFIPVFFFIFHQPAASAAAFFRPLFLCPILLLPALTWPFLVSYPQAREKIDWRLCCIHSQLSGRQHRVYRVPCPFVRIRSPSPASSPFGRKREIIIQLKIVSFTATNLFTRQELWSRTHSLAGGCTQFRRRDSHSGILCLL
jgi:hypothetical protein